MSRLASYQPAILLKMNLQSLTDGELIHEFVDARNQHAFDTLLRRHYQRLFRRFAAKIRDDDQAHDLCQTLWMRVLGNLADYRDDQKFEHYLNTIASNLLKDHWRGDRSASEVSLFDDEGADASEYGAFELQGDDGIDEERRALGREAMETLVHQVIPSLSCEQRLVYLLRHESEFWDEAQPLEWQHLAELNGLEVETAWRIFRDTRDKLLQYANGKLDTVDMDCLDNLVFLVWTQARRADKREKLTEQYFADLLNIPVNTFKTRYRASLKSLAEGMEKWR